ncbi:hypothetical protein ARMGADRAFT_518676 [Armillaria gallica]|uniref:Uncharacterized protein n=1 Tax=Armillaria gallica TaxID=47427 RepID=A0A2H3E7X2_ARMGA|nr:hypothetical protein ARMGADRAFT_518676 [Armillaria gallica]
MTTTYAWGPFALAMPGDFKNLGHTYYMNSTIQVIRVIPPLHLALNKASTTPAGHSRSLQQLSHTTEPLVPDSFLTAPRQAYPQFGEMAVGYLGGSHSKTWKKPTARSSTPCMKSLTRMIQARCTFGQWMAGEFQWEKNFEVDPSATSSRSHHHLRSS